ncbi:MAG: hypothetical protein ABIR26_02435, partial [Ramlibacter sp.]
MLVAAFAMLALLAGFPLASAATAAGAGFVEDIAYLPESRQIVIKGWAAPEKASVFTTNLIVSLDGEEIYRGRLERAERADVVVSTGRADWLWSGFRARIDLPARTGTGSHVVAARMRLGDGAEFELQSGPQARTVEVPATPFAPALWTRLVLLLAVVAPLVAFASPQRVLRFVTPTHRARLGENGAFAAAVLLSFVLLVMAGWTGSSLGLVLDQKSIAQHDEAPWLGELRRVRSDEWQVITPLAISQVSHEPRFPVVNRNLGPDGQNMLVIGMTGMPVAHVSALAKPATWGFFLFDLRRALAWSWWFPFFACFAALWVFLQRFFAVDWRLAAGLSLTLAAAPYSVVFSGWPAYAAFFPLAGLLAAGSAMRAAHWARAAVAGALLGLAVAGFALVLYPAWQISLGYLVVPFAIAWFLTRRAEFRFGAAQVLAIATALAVAGLLLGAWWLDAQDAVASIRATVYPGHRSVETGGDIDRWYLVKGLMSPISMYRESSLMWGASDAGSVVFFLLPALAAVALRWISMRRVDAVAAALCAYILVALVFMFVGFWPDLARWSLWGSTTSYRLDLALGLAQVLVFAWLAGPGRLAPSDGEKGRDLAAAVAVLSGLHAAWLYQLVQPAIIENIPASWVMVSVAALVAGSYLLLVGRHAAFLYVYGALMLSAALPFNPLGLATHAVTPAPALAEGVLAAETAAAKRGAAPPHGVVVVGERNWAMSLPAAGLPVVNSVFYYPQVSLWRRLDPQDKLRVVHNRYQRVLFVLEALAPATTFRIDAPRIDEVRVTLDPARFDFRLTGGASVLAPAGDAQALAANASLKVSRATPHWTLFAVLP